MQSPGILDFARKTVLVLAIVKKANGEPKMEIRKAYKAIEELKRQGFDMTIEKFYWIPIKKRYSIKENFTKEELLILAKLILDLCEENELKEMNIEYIDENEWKHK